MYMVKFNLHKPLAELEQRNNRRYSYVEIAEIAGLTRQGVRRLLKEQTERIDIVTFDKLLTFFLNEDMPVGVADLLEYTPDTPPNP